MICPSPTPVFKAARDLNFIGHGNCKGGFRPLLKKIIAVSGDRVTVGKVISVNGADIRNSEITESVFPRLGLDRPRSQIVPDGDVWVMGTVSESFDSRYFGPLSQQLIRARVVQGL